MTDRAINVCLALTMARHAIVHGQILVATQALHRLNRPVAGLAGDFRLDVWRVLEVNKIRHPNGLNPLEGFLPIPVASQFSYLRIGSRRNFVTAHATLRRGNTRYRGPACVDVTVLTGDLIVTCVDLVIKRNGLLRRRSRIGGKSQSHFYG